MFYEGLLKSKNTHILLLFLICCLGFALRIYKLDSRSLWIDEVFTLFHSTGHGKEIDSILEGERAIETKRLSPIYASSMYKHFFQYDPKKSINDVTMSLFDTDTHPPLYFWIMHFWVKYFGTTSFAIRFFSVLIGLVSVIGAFLITSVLFDKKTGLFSALFTAISPFLIFYSREARHYCLILTIALLANYFLLKFEKGNRDILFLLGLIILNVSGLYTHYLFSLVFLSQAVYFIIFSSSDKSKKNNFCIAFLISLLLSLPLVIMNLPRPHNFESIEAINLICQNSLFSIIRYIVKNIFSFFISLGEGTFILYKILNYLCIAGILFLFLRPFRKMPPELRHPAVFCSTLFFIPLISLSLIDFFKGGCLLQHIRFYIFSFAGLIPMVGYTLRYIWAGKIYKYVTVLVLTGVLISSILVVNGLAYCDVSIPRAKKSVQWINSFSGINRVALIMRSRRVVVLPVAFYLDENIIIAPVDSLEGIESAFKQFSGKVDTVFVVMPIFEKCIVGPIEGWVLKDSFSDFKFDKDYYFGDDYIKIKKFVCQK